MMQKLHNSSVEEVRSRLVEAAAAIDCAYSLFAKHTVYVWVTSTHGPGRQLLLTIYLP